MHLTPITEQLRNPRFLMKRQFAVSSFQLGKDDALPFLPYQNEIRHTFQPIGFVCVTVFARAYMVGVPSAGRSDLDYLFLE